MKKILPSLTALALLTASSLAWTAEDTPEKPANTAAAETEGEAHPAPRKISRWEDTGMKPAEAREWENYAFKPHEALAWRHAGFPPLVARTWSDKGFDPDEAAEWRDSTKNNRTLMADLDQSDPAQWKREGFTPRDRLAWWEAGFAFDDAVLLTRAGMGPADAAWHGHEKLKELKNQGGESATSSSTPAAADDSSWSLQDLNSLYLSILPHLKTGLIIALTLVASALAFHLHRSRRSNKQDDDEAEPDSTTPDNDTGHPPAAPAVKAKAHVLHTADRHRPARRTSFWTPATPTCVHCGSADIRISRIKPRRIAGIQFSEYFRCRNCGRHFSNVSYAPLAAAGISAVLLLTLCSAGIIHMLSLIP